MECPEVRHQDTEFLVRGEAALGFACFPSSLLFGFNIGRGDGHGLLEHQDDLKLVVFSLGPTDQFLVDSDHLALPLWGP